MKTLRHVLGIKKGGDVSARDSLFLGLNSCLGHLHILGQVFFVFVFFLPVDSYCFIYGER